MGVQEMQCGSSVTLRPPSSPVRDGSPPRVLLLYIRGTLTTGSGSELNTRKDVCIPGEGTGRIMSAKSRGRARQGCTTRNDGGYE